MIPAAGSADPIKSEDLEYQVFEDGGKRRKTDIYMDGFAIFRFVASDVSKWLKRFLEETEESAKEAIKNEDVLDILNNLQDIKVK